ncbi:MULTISPECIES: HIT family protein [unclassified Exiguobacterium]|uniref:HIT family protein n=1 Tax=unclassified Exiguobacterium TaxID=2644629 RepID=UPI001BE95426|nr:MULTISPECIES: HIT family protein [unclassified Exiguobacterium]
MHTDPTCIFCKIAQQEIPSYRVYEDEAVVAFLDLSQVTKGHTLVIPKHHTKNIYELPEDVAADVFKRIPTIANAIQRETGAIGMNVLSNAEEIAGQTVYHFHIHLIPRFGHEDGFGAKWITQNDAFTSEELSTLASSIHAHV